MIKETLHHSIIALIGHTTGELSHLCREQIKPVLKLEFHSFCTSANKSIGHTFGSPLWSRFSQTNLSHQRRKRHWPKDKHVHHKHVKGMAHMITKSIFKGNEKTRNSKSQPRRSDCLPGSDLTFSPTSMENGRILELVAYFQQGNYSKR